ncbi:MAG: hypothetical protein NC089_01680 [Bacteroides sp.]|nr:hypothetical protein [Bacteroides sp.]MCM1548833.1 hypothetical protein [Clostridium sp.]
MSNKKKQIIIIAIILLLCIAVTTTVVFITRNSGRKQEDQTVTSGKAHPEEQVADSYEDTSENATLYSNSTEGKKESEEENTTEEDSQSETEASTEEAGKPTTESGSTADGNKPTGGTNNTPPQTTAQSTTQAPNTTEQPTGGNQVGSTHQHTWQAQYRTVHHDEEGHYGNVCVKEAYDEPIYEGHYVCNYCGKDITASGEGPDHCIACGPPYPPDHLLYGQFETQGSSYGTIRVQVGTTHHEAVYEEKWIVDKKAYDEQVLDGYKCTTCGATK